VINDKNVTVRLFGAALTFLLVSCSTISRGPVEFDPEVEESFGPTVTAGRNQIFLYYKDLPDGPPKFESYFDGRWMSKFGAIRQNLEKRYPRFDEPISEYVFFVDDAEEDLLIYAFAKRYYVRFGEEKHAVTIVGARLDSIIFEVSKDDGKIKSSLIAVPVKRY
jgi:hypothetical protein